MKTELLLLLLFIFMVCHWCQNYDCKFLTYNLCFKRIFSYFGVHFLFQFAWTSFFGLNFHVQQSLHLVRLLNWVEFLILVNFSFRQTFSFGWTFIWINFFRGRLFIRVIASFNLARDWCRLLRDHGNCISCSAIRKNGAVLRRKM